MGYLLVRCGQGVARVRRGAARFARPLSILAVLAVAAFMIRQVLAGGSALGAAAARLTHPALPWIVLAIACEAASYLFYAAAQRRLLGRDDDHPGVGWLASLAVCAQGINNFLPAGYLAANVLNFRELRRRGIGAARSGWLLVMSSSLYIGVIAALTAISASSAGGRAGAAMQAVQIGAGGILLTALLLIGGAYLLSRRGAPQLPSAWRSRLQSVQASPRTIAGAGCLFLGSWVADAACLVASLHAIGATPPWSLVPIAYCAAQLVSFLPITPGGIGLVEGSMTMTLMGSGGSESHILAAVLLYRIISYWATLPFGMIGYLTVLRGRQRGSTTVDEDGVNERSAARDPAAGGDRSLVVLGG